MASHAANITSSIRLQETLAILLDGNWHDGAEITGKTESQALHTDIHELRENGYGIEQRYNGRTEKKRRISQYRLVRKAGRLMGKMKEHPRYNILSCRVSDEELKRVEAALQGDTMQSLLHAALMFVLQIRETPVIITTRRVA